MKADPGDDEEKLAAGAAGESPAAADPAAAPDIDLDAAAPAPAADDDEDDGFMSPAEAKLAEANERYVRLMADFDNFRKRSSKERTELLQGAGEDLLRDVLPVVDNLERALAAGAAAGANAADAVVKGVELTLRQFKSVLARHGVERIEAAGQPFDPHRHEAIAQVEREDVTEDTVAEELESGYLVRGRVLRPVKVRVAKPKAVPAAAPDGETPG